MTDDSQPTDELSKALWNREMFRAVERDLPLTEADAWADAMQQFMARFPDSRAAQTVQGYRAFAEMVERHVKQHSEGAEHTAFIEDRLSNEQWKE